MIFNSSNAPLAPNAAWRLVEALGSLHEPSGRVRIPGFYDAVRPPTETERRLMERFPIDTQFLRQSWKVDHLLGSGTDPVTLTRHLLYAPTCNICGMWSGYQGPGGKTILPAKAGAKLDFRLVPDQDPETMLTLLRRHLAEQGFGDVGDPFGSVITPGSEFDGDTADRYPCPLGPICVRHRTSRITTQARLRSDGGTLPALWLAGRQWSRGRMCHDGSRVHGPDEHVRLG